MKKTKFICCKKEGVVFTPKVPTVPTGAAVQSKQVQFPLHPAPATFISKLHGQYLMDPENNCFLMDNCMQRVLRLEMLNKCTHYTCRYRT